MSGKKNRKRAKPARARLQAAFPDKVFLCRKCGRKAQVKFENYGKAMPNCHDCGSVMHATNGGTL